MPKILYTPKNFSAASMAVIKQAVSIINVYAAQGYDLTLRQLYYQFVARDLIKNKLTEYKRLGSIINDARLAGMIDWDHITDRTRAMDSNSHWESPESIVNAVAEQFRYDLWEDQPNRVEVWVEKEALAGVFERVCRELDIAWFSCRGYVSQSELWSAAMRMKGYQRAGQQPVILHFGDHDPSGIDMTRDIRDRMEVFGAFPEVRRLALNMDQIDQYDPPPNPAKFTDSRFAGYVSEYGDESWELDALEPAVLADIVRDEVAQLRDEELFDAAEERQDEAKRLLQAVADNWSEVVEIAEEREW